MVPNIDVAALLLGVLGLGWGQLSHFEKAPHMNLMPTKVGELDSSIIRVG